MLQQANPYFFNGHLPTFLCFLQQEPKLTIIYIFFLHKLIRSHIPAKFSKETNINTYKHKYMSISTTHDTSHKTKTKTKQEEIKATNIIVYL